MNRFREKSLAIWMPVGSPDRAIPIVFNEAHVEVDADGVRISDAAPTAWVNLWDAPNIGAKDILQINNTAYSIVDCKPDGYGMSEIVLREI